MIGILIGEVNHSPTGLAVAAALFGYWSSRGPMELVAIVSGGNITPERRKALLDGIKA